MVGSKTHATTAAAATATSETINRRRSSARCSASVMASGEGRGARRRRIRMATGSSGQFMLGSSGTAAGSPHHAGSAPALPAPEGTAPGGVPHRRPGRPSAGPLPVVPCPGNRLLSAREAADALPAPAEPGDPSRADPLPAGGGTTAGYGPGSAEPAGSAEPLDCSAARARSCSSANRSRKGGGERTASALRDVGGRSGNDPRTSLSRRARHWRNCPQAAPSWRATRGSLSGPSTTTATIRTIRSFGGLRIPMWGRVYGPGSAAGPAGAPPHPGGRAPGAGTSGASEPSRAPRNSEEAEARERPEAQDHVPHDEPSGDRPEDAAVRRVPTVVAHDEVLPWRHGHRREGLGLGARRQPGLGQRPAVDLDLAPLT